MIEKLVLVRHGETLHNVSGIAQGWTDSALSDKGRQQVELLAKRIARENPGVIFSSPLQRALTTATTVAAAAGLPVETLDDLREMGYGAWEGQSFLDVRRDFEETYRRWVGDADCPCPDGESHNDVLRRVKRALDTISAKARRAVLITHGTAIRIAATALLEAPVMSARFLAVDNASVSVFVRRGDRLVMKVWNDTRHLETMNDEG